MPLQLAFQIRHPQRPLPPPSGVTRSDLDADSRVWPGLVRRATEMGNSVKNFLQHFYAVPTLRLLRLDSRFPNPSRRCALGLILNFGPIYYSSGRNVNVPSSISGTINCLLLRSK